MFEIISLVVGGIGRLLPEVLGYFKQGQENAHELALVDKQVELAKVQGEQKRAEIAAQGDQDRQTLGAQTEANTVGAWDNALIEAIKTATAPTGNKMIDALSASVRPILTYWWCLLLYTAHKVVLLFVAWQGHAALGDFAPLVLTEFDRAVVGSIIGFWFADRALRKFGK